MSVDWKEPPPQRRRDWSVIASELAASPGRWAIVAEAVTGGGSGAKTSLRNAMPRSAFQFRGVPAQDSHDGKRRYDVYARFLGNNPVAGTAGHSA